MGHTRIKKSINTKPFRKVTVLINNDAGCHDIAAQVLDAAHKGFNYDLLLNDNGYQEAVRLMVHLGQAAKSKDFIGYFKKLGLELSDCPNIVDLKAELAEYLERSCKGKPRTDITEIATNSLLYGIQKVVDLDQRDLLFKPTSDDYLNSYSRLKNADNYSELGRIFFAEVMYQGLQKYLSREIPQLVSGSLRMPSIHEKRAFDSELREYCYENARVVKSFCVDWLGLHEYKLRDVDKAMPGFAKYGLEKIFKAMKYYENE